MTRMVWFVAGAGAGVYAMVKARRTAEAFTPDGMRDRLSALAVGAELFSSELRTGMEEKESQLRTQMGLALDRGAPRALKGGGSETLSGARTPSAPTARSSTTPSLEDTD
ncbi:MAG TPA: DUF6167 family protein [Marmoricola sp.]|nr:DUF6167 family protein [Marmoricola sp.]